MILLPYWLETFETFLKLFIKNRIEAHQYDEHKNRNNLNNAFPVKNEHNSPVTKTTATKTIQKYCEVRSIAKIINLHKKFIATKTKIYTITPNTELKTKT